MTAGQGAIEEGRFLPAITAYQQQERQDKRKGNKKATTPTKNKAAVTFGEEPSSGAGHGGGGTGGTGGESPQMSHAAKRQARKEAKEARKAAVKLKILGSSDSSKIPGTETSAFSAGQSGRGAYFDTAVDPLEERVFEADNGMIMHTTIVAPDIAEVVPLPMPPITLVPEDTEALLAPNPPSSSVAAAPGGSEQGVDTVARSSIEQRQNSSRSIKEKGTEGSVTLPPI